MKHGVLWRSVIVVVIVVSVFSVRWDRVGTPLAQVEGVGTGICSTWDESCQCYIQAPCDFGTGEEVYVDDYGGYGGGCATSSDSYSEASSSSGYTVENPPPNVVVGYDGNWHPETGYCWAYPDSENLSVLPIGSPVPNLSNVVFDGNCAYFPAVGFVFSTPNDPAASGYAVTPANLVDLGNGYFEPAPGYCFANLTDETDLSVLPVGAVPPGYANIQFGSDCHPIPSPGYQWVTPSDPASDGYAVIAMPRAGDSVPNLENVVFGQYGEYLPASGYDWVAPGVTGDYRVIAMVPGTAVPYLENVVYAPGGFAPASNYVWANADNPDDLRVVLAGAANAYTRLSIVDVPSPTGYRDPVERQMQIAMLTDAQIDTEIARMRRMFEAMQRDFQNDTATMESWLDVAQNAELEALLESVNLLGGGLIKWAGEKGSAAAPYGELAQSGIKATTYLKRAAALQDSDPAQAEIELKLAREILIDAYDRMYKLDPGLVSEHGGNVAELANFAIEYSYEMCRWALAYEQIQLISENLGKDNGKLRAQQAIQALYEQLIEERNRRKALN